MTKQYWSGKAKSLTPYTAGEQPREKFIKLNTNENAYPPSPRVAEAVLREAANLRLYPSPNADGLRHAIAEHLGVAQGRVFCANGSDEALALCFSAFFQGAQKDASSGGWFPGMDGRAALLAPDITYSFYPVWSDFFDVPLQTAPLREDFTIDTEKMLGARGVVFANPNAPTGIALPIAEVERIVRGTNGVVLVDEAYIAFGGESAVPLIDRYPNLAVVRTLSKSHALAGLRVGYVVAQESLIGALQTVKDSFNSYPVDRLAQAGAEAAVRDTAYYQKTVREIVATREYTAAQLGELGIACLPSSANFLFVSCPGRAPEIFSALRGRGILVRHFDQSRIRGYLRVTIGTREEMDAFLAAMEDIL